MASLRLVKRASLVCVVNVMPSVLVTSWFLSSSVIGSPTPV